MRVFVLSEISEFLTDERHVAYCYKGRMRRGSIGFFNNGSMLVVTPDGYMSSYDDEIQDNSGFELWALVHEIEDEDTKQEALNRFYDIYNNLYHVIPVFQEYPFITE